MMGKTLLVAAGVVLVAGCASTTSEPQDAQPTADRNELVCEKITPTGSKLPKKVCYWTAGGQTETDPNKRSLQQGMIERTPGPGISRSSGPGAYGAAGTTGDPR